MDTSDSFDLQEQPALVDSKKEGQKIGLLNGSFALLLLYGSYFMGMNAFVSVQWASSFIPYMIIVLLISGFQLRKKNGGYLSFKQAIKFTFLSYVIAAVMIAVGTYVLYNLIDKTLTEKTINLSLEKTRSFMERMGASEGEIDKAVDKMKEQDKQTGIKTIILGTGIGLIWDFVKSLLISLLIKKEKPVFGQV